MAITLVPALTTTLIEKMNKASIYSRAFFRVKKNSKHVVILGNLESTLLKEFFGELFHEDHEDLNLRVVILQPELPNAAMLSILHDPLYSLNVLYLEGSALNEKDLVRARIDRAIGIFIMADKNALNADQEDAKSILQHFCVRKFLSETETSPLICLQIIRQENIRHISIRDSESDESGDDLIVCLNEIKMGLIAKTVLYPGANTLIFNLLASFSDGNDNNDEEEDDDLLIGGKSSKTKVVDVIDKLENIAIDNWEDEYTRGCDWEIYTSELSSSFIGIKFSELAYAIYFKLGILLIGLKIEEKKGKYQSRILLNPGSMKVKHKNYYYHLFLYIFLFISN